MKFIDFIKILGAIFFFFILVQCSKEEEDITITVSYDATSYQLDFRSEGNISPPTADWSGEIGTFTLKNTIDGLQINTETGEISWGKNLSIGEHDVTIIAQNSKSTTETLLVLNNTLKDSFWSGGQNNDTTSQEIEYNRQFWLFEDGTLEVEIIGQADSKGVGTWSIEGNIFRMHFCTYCQDANPLDIPSSDEHGYYEGVLTNESLIASINGQWYVIRFDPDSTQLRGNFYLEWD